MKRRAFLRAAGVAGGASVSGSVVTSRSRAAFVRRQGGYEPLGRLPVTGAAEAVPGDDGETAYVAATTGFATVDVSDPAEPTLLAEERDLEHAGDALTQLLDVTVDGDRLVVAGPANPSFSVKGFRVYDVSDPATPVPTGEFETSYHIHNCYLEGDLLFVVANEQQANPLVIFDIGGGDITQLGYWSLLDREPGWGEIRMLARYLHDVYVQDDIAYLPHWNAGTYLIDVSDPAAPTYVSHVRATSLEEQRSLTDRQDAVYGLPGNDHYAAVDESGDLMAVGREAWATGGATPDRPGGIDLYDVSDPAAPVHRGSIDAPRTVDETYRGGLWTTSHNFELRDGRLYSSWYRAGVQIHDVSEPTDPTRLAWWRDPAKTGFWTARVVAPGESFIASSTEAIPNTTLEGALYTFPAEAGEQADPPSLQDPDWLAADNETNTTNESGETGNGSATGGGDTGGGDTGGGDAGGGDTGGDTGGGDAGGGDTGGDSIPGFTGVAGLASGALTLEWLRRRGGNVQD
ncbi:LVIVD repeat-containing protein [Natrinema sp. 74]|uniref:LVIVD repeat-containing protein n=1 Tax=Natrinema sp. 74 TaxID=3384159 RepID=UPI0038D3CD16